MAEALSHPPNAKHPTFSLVDRVCADLFLSRHARDRDDNLLFVRDRIIRGEVEVATVLDLYAQLRAGASVRSDDLRPAVTTLLLSGLVRAEGDRLRVRNRIYERVFDRQWVRDRMPDAEARRQRAAYQRGLLRATTVAGIIVLGMVILAMTALGYAEKAEHSRQEASVRAGELKTALTARDAALRKLEATLQAEAVQRQRADRETDRARQQERQADLERQEALRQKRAAQAQTLTSRERQAHLMVAYGARLQDEGDLYGSLLWLAPTVEMGGIASAHQAANRTRIAALLRRLPRLSHLWFDVRSARLSPDGRKVVTANADGFARIWDAATGAQSAPPLRHGKTLAGVLFSPDGRRVLTFGDDGLRIWGTQNGLPLTGLLAHQRRVLDAAFSADGQRMVSGDIGGTVRLWDVHTGQILRVSTISGAAAHVEFSLDRRHIVITTGGIGGLLLWDVEGDDRALRTLPLAGATYYATFSPNGRRVVGVGGNGAAQVFDTVTGQPISPAMRHSQWITHACFSPDGARIATASGDRTAQIWDAVSGARLTPPLAHGSDVSFVAFSPDGRRLATTGTDSTARIWDAGTGESLTPPLKHSGYVLTAAFDLEGSSLLTVDTAGIARLWEVAGTEMPDLYPGEYSNVASAAFSPDGRHLATGDFDSSARVWDTLTGLPVTALLPHGATVRQIAFSPDGKRLATAGDDATARIWDAGSGKLLVTLRHAYGVGRLIFDTSGRRLATADGSEAYIWETKSGRQVCALRGHLRSINSIAFSPDGSRLVTAAMDHTARVWNAVSGKTVLILRHGNYVTSACFSPNGRSVLTASHDKRATLWDASNGRLILRSFLNEGGVESAVFSADGCKIVTSCAPGEARVWDAATGEATIPPLRHGGPVIYAAFSHSGRFVVTCSYDRTARIWDATTGEAITPPLRHNDFVRHAAFSPDDRCVLTLCDDGVARLWTLPQDNHSATELRHMAELLSAHRLTSSGGIGTLEPDALRAAWRALAPALREGYGPSRRQRDAWDVTEALKDHDLQAWPQFLRHLDRLIADQPWNRQFHALRAYGYAQTGQWTHVTADNARIDRRHARLILLEAHRPMQVVTPGERPLEIGPARYGQGLLCPADNQILALLPGPGKRFTAVAGIATMASTSANGTFTHSVLIGGREVFRSTGLHQGQPGRPVDISLSGATALVLQIRHSGPDAYGAWAEGRIDLMDGRSFRLSELPIVPLGGL